uniref:UNC93-like protein MFSD11 n=1 Tax=Angiostrongylus cantonensis TaxID=6313 RepID=A0A0K0DLN0_ANGCA
MQLSPRRHELLSVYMLGVGTLFMYLGYIMQLFIAESVIHAVSVRRPGVVSPLAGYYGQAFHYSAFAISSVITPSIQHYVASKWILTIASVLFAVYYLGFMQLNNVYFYLSQALMGIGYSFYNNGEGAYLSEHSSRRTIESNTGIETANISANEEATHTFTDPQIQLIYGIFFILNVISVVIFALLPTKQYDSIASNSPTVLPNFKQQLKQFAKSFINVNMVLLLPFFCYMGLIVSFVVGVYPTTLTFTSTFSGDIYIIAIYSMAMGAAEIFGELLSFLLGFSTRARLFFFRYINTYNASE